MPVNKNDMHAREHWGSEIYDSFPKSVWATMAWRLADRLGGGYESAAQVFADEMRALVLNGIIPESQVKAIKKI